MNILKQSIAGKWRSYRIFHWNGKIEHHHESLFAELSVDQYGFLNLLHVQEKSKAVALDPGAWTIEQLKKSWFILFGKRRVYEIITVEQEDLVLMDIVKGEKIFFTKLPGWHQRIEPIITSARHIQPGKETKDK